MCSLVRTTSSASDERPRHLYLFVTSVLKLINRGVVKIPVHPSLTIALPMISQSMVRNWEPRKVIIEGVEGIKPAYLDRNIKTTNKVIGTALKLNKEYSTIVDIRFIKTSHNIDYSFNSFGNVPCQTTITPPCKEDYKEGDRERVVCTFKPLRVGKDFLDFTVREKNTNGVIDLLRDQVAIGITVRPTMDWEAITNLQGVSMAAREGAVTFLFGLCFFFWVLRLKVTLSNLILIPVMLGWIGITFAGQILIWLILDKLFLSMPERVFTVLGVLNLPAMISVSICFFVTWIVFRGVVHG